MTTFDYDDNIIIVLLLAKVQVNGIERWPSTLERQRLNTERALEFLRDDCVVLHQDACRGKWYGMETSYLLYDVC